MAGNADYPRFKLATKRQEFVSESHGSQQIHLNLVENLIFGLPLELAESHYARVVDHCRQDTLVVVAQNCGDLLMHISNALRVAQIQSNYLATLRIQNGSQLTGALRLEVVTSSNYEHVHVVAFMGNVEAIRSELL